MSNDSDKMNKPPVVDFPDKKSIDTQAAEWLALLDGENPSKQALHDFRIWINEKPEHREAFEELVDFWGDLNTLTQVVLPREDVQKKANFMPRAFSGFWLVASCAALLLIVVIAFWQLPLFKKLDPQPVVYATKVGEQRTIELPDHSVVFLNTNTEIEVNYDNALRRIKLVRGEAYFDVFHDPEKPFEVFAGTRLVRALGTAFTIHVRKVDVEVIVTEGVVEINPADAITLNVSVSERQALSDVGQANSEIQSNDNGAVIESSVQVKAGNIASYDRHTLDQVKTIVAQQIEDKLSWKQGVLLFTGEPLEQVVKEVSRYTSLKILIPERKARELKIGGVFKVGDTESLFEALNEGFDIRVNKVSDDMVYLISAENN